jgi:parallel beta-helix repeat protein
LRIVNNSCQSSATANTYCFHIVDAANGAFGYSTVNALVRDNSCRNSETCISLEHVEQARVTDNDCSSQAFGIELYNSMNAIVSDNDFDFPPDVPGCEIRLLMTGEKIDLSRVKAGAGLCVTQA